MKKWRYNLSIWIIFFTSTQVFLGHSIYNDNFVMHCKLLLAPFTYLNLTAITVYVSTLFRVDETVLGDQCYLPNNFLWKAITKAFPFVKKEIRLCKMFWLTLSLYLAVSLYLMCGAILIGLCYFMYIAIVGGNGTISNLQEIFYIFLIVMTIIGTIILIYKAIEKYVSKNAAENLIITISSLIIIVFSCLAWYFLLWPLLKNYASAIHVLPIWALLGLSLFVGMVTIAGITKLSFMYFPELKETRFGSIFFKIEDKLCDKVYGCQLVPVQTNN